MSLFEGVSGTKVQMTSTANLPAW
jgi:hypothetical protein